MSERNGSPDHSGAGDTQAEQRRRYEGAAENFRHLYGHLRSRRNSWETGEATAPHSLLFTALTGPSSVERPTAGEPLALPIRTNGGRRHTP